MIRGHTAEGIGRAHLGNRAFIAIHTTVMANLHEQRSVSEPVAPLNAFCAADAELFVDGVFIVGVFDESAFDGRGGAQLIFGAGVQVVGLWIEVPGAKLAITADSVRMDALNGRLREHTTGGAEPAADAFLRIDLPDRTPRCASAGEAADQTAQAGHRGDARAIAHKLAARNGFWGGRFQNSVIMFRCARTLSALLVALHDPDICGHQIENVNPPL